MLTQQLQTRLELEERVLQLLELENELHKRLEDESLFMLDGEGNLLLQLSTGAETYEEWLLVLQLFVSVDEKLLKKDSELQELELELLMELKLEDGGQIHARLEHSHCSI